MNTILRRVSFSFIFLVVGMLLFVAMGVIGTFFTANQYAFSLIIIICLYGLSTIFLRLEKLSLASVHLIPNRVTSLKLFYGLVTGWAIVGLMLYVLFTLTSLDLKPSENQSLFSFLLASIVFIPLALMEEILFRGYSFFRLTHFINIRLVILITSILFALYHYNGNQTIIELLLGPGIWGVTFGVAAYLSKSIAFPLGIHISANVIQAYFGLKSEYLSMWTIFQSEETTVSTFSSNELGILMQLVLLTITIFVFEIFCRNNTKIVLQKNN